MGFFVLVVAGIAAGDRVLRRIGGNGLEAAAFQLLAGLCVCGIFIVVVGSYSLRAAFWIVLSATVAWLIHRVWLYIRERNESPPSESLRKPLSPLEKVCLAVVVIANLLAVFSALAPNTSWDAGAAHLALPSDYVRQGHIGLIEGNVYSAYPHLLHALYAFSFMWGGETSVAIFNWLFGPLACIALFALGRRIRGRRTGLIAAAIFASSPIFFDQVGTVSIDVPFAGLSVAALTAFVAWHDERRREMLILAAFLAGSSCGIRHTGYLVSLLLFAAVFVVSRERRLSSAMVFAGVAAVAASPWLLRSAILAGNPFYPFLSNVFASPQLPDLQTTILAQHETVSDLSLTALLRFPWDLIMRPEHYDGWSASPGALLLVLGLPGLFVGNARTRWLAVYCVAGLVTFFYFQRFARYLLPFFMPMMVVAAVAYADLPRLRRPLAVLLILFFGYGLALGGASVHFKIPVALGLESPETYLSTRIEVYDAFRWVNEHVPANDSVMTMDPRSYFIDRPTFQNYAVLPKLAEKSKAQRMAWFNERKIRFLVYPRAFFRGSPAYVARGYTDIVEEWLRDADHFRLVNTIDAPDARGEGRQRVEIYEIYIDPAVEKSHLKAWEFEANVGA